jgi:hypothetical protein
LKAVWLGAVSTSPFLPGLLLISWANDRKSAVIERDKKSGRLVGTLRGKGCEPTVVEVFVDVCRALNTMALAWCSRLGPGQLLAHIKVDPVFDE